MNILLEDNFPGYAEEIGWDDSWTQGVGSIQYFSEEPGFVRLMLSGPGVAGRYHNAEKIYSGSSQGFLYCNVEVRLRNSNNNGWDALNAATTPDSNYGFGSRGWGFWNMKEPPQKSNVIWFSSISPESGELFRGTRIWVILEGVPVLIRDLNIDLMEWHVYRIKWRKDYIGLYIDDISNPVAEITDKDHIPNKDLIFTVWIDNYRVVGDISNMNKQYLEVPDMKQYIDVDYIKIYQ